MNKVSGEGHICKNSFGCKSCYPWTFSKAIFYLKVNPESAIKLIVKPRSDFRLWKIRN
jgi:hypothetical protein